MVLQWGMCFESQVFRLLIKRYFCCGALQTKRGPRFFLRQTGGVPARLVNFEACEDLFIAVIRIETSGCLL